MNSRSNRGSCWRCGNGVIRFGGHSWRCRSIFPTPDNKGTAPPLLGLGFLGVAPERSFGERTVPRSVPEAHIWGASFVCHTFALTGCLIVLIIAVLWAGSIVMKRINKP